MLGGGIVISIFIIILFSTSLFNYRLQVKRVYINTSENSAFDISEDSVFTIKESFEKKFLNDIKENRTILTPQEYTNNIVEYYNTVLLILSVMLAAFSFVSFVYLKSLSKDLINEKLQSDEFKEDVVNLLVGKAEDRVNGNLSEHAEQLKRMENEIAKLKENNIGDEDTLE